MGVRSAELSAENPKRRVDVQVREAIFRHKALAPKRDLVDHRGNSCSDLPFVTGWLFFARGREWIDVLEMDNSGVEQNSKCMEIDRNWSGEDWN